MAKRLTGTALPDVLSDDEVAKIGIEGPDPSVPLSDDDVLASGGFDPTPIDPNQSRAGQMLLNGLTLGLRPRIQAALESGEVSGPDYEKAKREQWTKDDAYARLNPIKSFALEATGALPTMFVPGLGAGRLAQAATRAAGPAQNLTRSQRLARIAGFGPEIGTVGSEAGALGAKSAALTGALSSREDDVGGRLTSGALSAPFGYVMGRGGSAIGERVARGAEDLVDMNRVGGNSNLGALTALRRGIERDGISTNDMRHALTPNTGRAQVVPQGHETILNEYGNAIANGLSIRQARQVATRSYATLARSQGSNLNAATLNEHVRRILNDYTDANQIPLAIDEVARLAGGRGQNLQWTRRAAAASPNHGREEIFNTVTSRQEDIIPAVRERVSQTLGDPNYEQSVQALVRANREAEGRLYGAAKDAETPFDLSHVFDEVNATYAFRGGKARALMDDASRIMRGDPLPGGGYERHTIDTYIQSRGQLNDLIEESKRQLQDGTSQATTATRALMDLKRKMDEVVATANPAWRHANDLTAGGRSVENAMRDGADMKLSMADGHTRRVVNRVEELRTSARNLRRQSNLSNEDQARLALIENQIAAHQMGFARRVHSELSRLGDTHDVSKLFLRGGRNAQDGVKRIMSVMLGEDAPRFMGMIERAQIAGTTYKNQFNSQTTPLRETIDELNENGKVAGAVQGLKYWANPRAMAQDLAEAISRRLNEGRNTELLNRYTTMSDNPANFFALLREIDSVGLGRSRAFTNPHLNAYSLPGSASGAFSSGITQENKRRF